MNTVPVCRRKRTAAKRCWLGVAAGALGVTVACLLAAPGVSFADGPSISLSVGYPQPVGSLSFDLSSDPTSQSSVTSSPASFGIEVITENTDTWTLQVNADEAYLDPATRLIPVGNISWSATGTGFVGGVLSVTPQTVATGAGSNTFTGTVSFSMLNEWTYPTGSYSDTITYTAIAI